jgi:hypothetical protein
MLPLSVSNLPGAREQSLCFAIVTHELLLPLAPYRPNDIVRLERWWSVLSNKAGNNRVWLGSAPHHLSVKAFLPCSVLLLVAARTRRRTPKPQIAGYRGEAVIDAFPSKQQQ